LQPFGLQNGCKVGELPSCLLRRTAASPVDSLVVIQPAVGVGLLRDADAPETASEAHTPKGLSAWPYGAPRSVRYRAPRNGNLWAGQGNKRCSPLITVFAIFTAYPH
jgi:hypothetical protein